MTTPIFLLSLPRSGSTLLQRMLASHDEIDTIAEPWVLLPFFTALEERTVYAEYGQMTLHKAFENVLSVLPNGINDYYEVVRESTTKLYGKLSQKETCYFLDKTPRYHLVAEHIIRAFPDAKTIFLWRNPLSVVASLLTMSSEKGTWKDFHRYKIDLYKGFDKLFQAFTLYGKYGMFLQYEDIITYPLATLNKLENFLDIQFSPETLDVFLNKPLLGNLGDQRGTALYEGISNKSLTRWKQVLCTPSRKKWAKEYLSWIGDTRLNKIGYEYDTLVDELETLPFSRKKTISDWSEYNFYRFVYAILDPTIIKHKTHQLFNNERTYPLF